MSLLDDVAASLGSGGFGVSLGNGGATGDGGDSGSNAPANVTATREEVNELLTAGASALDDATSALAGLTEVSHVGCCVEVVAPGCMACEAGACSHKEALLWWLSHALPDPCAS